MEVESESSVRRRRRVLDESEKRALIARHAESGKSVADFCRDEGIAMSSFHAWRRKPATKSVFIEVSVPGSSVAVEVVLVSGDKVVTSSDCDPSWLAKLVRALGAPPC